MIDSAVKDAIDDAIRFLRDGDWHLVEINTHEIVIVKLTSDHGSRERAYLIACTTCKALLVDSVRAKHAYLTVHRHVDSGSAVVDSNTLINPTEFLDK